MTKQGGVNPTIAAMTLFLLVGGLIMIFPLDQLWVGIAMFAVGLVIIVFKVAWSIAGWADNTIQCWLNREPASKDGFDVTFRVREEDDET